jgi:hypothetical protein
MTFNPDLSLYQNVKLGLMVGGSNFEKACKELGAAQSSVRERLYKNLVRDGKSTPLDKQIFEYMEKNCRGFSDYCIENDLKIVS